MGHLDRRQFLSRLAGTAAAWPLAGGAASYAGQPKGQQPNILFIFSDQQRWDTVGCYGSPLFEGLTPNLDRLARQGVRFQHAFTCQPVCGPARSCLQTGKYATETGCFRNGIALPQDETTIAHRLSAAGYEVGYIGKWHLASTHGIPDRDANYRIKPIPPERRGGYRDFWLASDILEFTSHSYDGHMFDGKGARREFPKDRYRVDAQTDWALEYLEGRDSTRPFFLFVSYIEPHHQNDHRHFEGPRGSKERFADHRVPGDLVDTKGDWRAEMPDYLGCCWSLDQNVGRIMEWLGRKGLADNTLVVYTSDHACHFRTRNGEYKRACHDNAIRVPMILRGPGFQGGAVVDRLASLIDLPPTLLRAAGAEPPQTMKGRPLQEALAKDATDWPNEVFVQISESQVGRAIRTSRWKYGVRAQGKSGGKDSASDRYTEDALYDLERDPHERNNLVGDAKLSDVRAQLAKRLKRRMRAAGEAEPEIVPVRSRGNEFSQAQASRFARLALDCVGREYPNKLDHVMNDGGEVQSPSTLHPAFYGCFDWHSAVHGHWMLVRLLKRFPNLPEGPEIRQALRGNLRAENIEREVAYLHQANRKSFERTYGWAWLLKLAEELHDWDDPDGRAWSANLAPLARAIVDRYTDFLPRQTYPIRTGVHPNTAFGIAFALDYARAVGDENLEALLLERSLTYYSQDRDGPAAWEPSGADFFSPCLMEADLMRRVMAPKAFRSWLHDFLPDLRTGGPPNLLEPAVVGDRTDPKIVHLDGLNLSRAWCMGGIASSLPPSDPARSVLTEAALTHARDALTHVTSGQYEGEHWLASFAVYMLSAREGEGRG